MTAKAVLHIAAPTAEKLRREPTRKPRIMTAAEAVQPLAVMHRAFDRAVRGEITWAEYQRLSPYDQSDGEGA